MKLSGLLPDLSTAVDITVSDGRIATVSHRPNDGRSDFERVICPGFIDVQVNGQGGIAFNDPAVTTEQITSVTRRLQQTGVALYLPTLITDSFDNMVQGVSAIDRAREQSDAGRSVLGIHLEGPYLSHVDGPRGAHPLAHCRAPDWDEFLRFQEAARGLVRLMTLAPELPGAIQFIEKLVASGVRVAIGHTAANSDQIRAAIAAGATMSTHLGNAAHDQLQRHRNYVYDQLAADEIWASLIVDGHHLPPELVKIFVRAKRPERVILVSDAAMWADLPPGVYPWGHCSVEVRADGWIGVVGQPRLAGSGLLLKRGIENVVRFTGISFEQAVRMATEYPAKMLHEPQLGTIEPGRDATFTIVHWNRRDAELAVLETIVAGEVVYRKE